MPLFPKPNEDVSRSSSTTVLPISSVVVFLTCEIAKYIFFQKHLYKCLTSLMIIMFLLLNCTAQSLFD